MTRPFTSVAAGPVRDAGVDADFADGAVPPAEAPEPFVVAVPAHVVVALVSAGAVAAGLLAFGLIVAVGQLIVWLG